MKKSQFYSLICFISLPILCIILLRKCLDMQCEDIIEELIVAILTGCVLAIPSTVIGLIKSRRSTENDLHNIIFRTKRFVSDLTFNSEETIQLSLNIIVELHESIEKVLSKNIIKDVDKIETINKCLFKLSLDLKGVLETLPYLSTNNLTYQMCYNAYVDNINDLKTKILSEIDLLDFEV